MDNLKLTVTVKSAELAVQCPGNILITGDLNLFGFNDHHLNSVIVLSYCFFQHFQGVYVSLQALNHKQLQISVVELDVLVVKLKKSCDRS